MLYFTNNSCTTVLHEPNAACETRCRTLAIYTRIWHGTVEYVEDSNRTTVHVHFSHLSASQRTVVSIFWSLLDLQHTFKHQTIPPHTCLKLIQSIRSVLTSICSICDSDLYTVCDQYSHRSTVCVSQTYSQYMISIHIDLQYTCLKPIHSTCIWSVLTSICSKRISNLFTVYDQYSHRSVVYVTQTYTQYVISTHIDLQYVCLKPKHGIWPVLTSICSICDSNRYAVYNLYSHRSAVYGTQIDTQYMICTHIDLLCMGLKAMCSIWSVLTSMYSIHESSRYAVSDRYSHRSALYVTQIAMQCMFKVPIDLQIHVTPNRSPVHVQPSHWPAVPHICRARASLRSMFNLKTLRRTRTWMTRNRVVLWLWKFKSF